MPAGADSDEECGDEEIGGGDAEVLLGSSKRGDNGEADFMAEPEFEGMWESKADNRFMSKKMLKAMAPGHEGATAAVGCQFAKSKMEVDILNK